MAGRRLNARARPAPISASAIATKTSVDELPVRGKVPVVEPAASVTLELGSPVAALEDVVGV